MEMDPVEIVIDFKKKAVVLIHACLQLWFMKRLIKSFVEDGEARKLATNLDYEQLNMISE